jgi:antitoxin HicB
MFPYRAVVEWSQADECFIARAPAFEALATHGDTPEAAVRELGVAGAAMVEVMKETGRPVPEPDANVADFAGKVALRIPRSVHARVARLAQHEDVSINQLLVSIIAEGLGRRAPVAHPGSVDALMFADKEIAKGRRDARATKAARKPARAKRVA